MAGTFHHLEDLWFVLLIPAGLMAGVMARGLVMLRSSPLPAPGGAAPAGQSPGCAGCPVGSCGRPADLACAGRPAG